MFLILKITSSCGAHDPRVEIILGKGSVEFLRLSNGPESCALAAPRVQIILGREYIKFFKTFQQVRLIRYFDKHCQPISIHFSVARLRKNLKMNSFTCWMFNFFHQTWMYRPRYVVILWNVIALPLETVGGRTSENFASSSNIHKEKKLVKITVFVRFVGNQTSFCQLWGYVASYETATERARRTRLTLPRTVLQGARKYTKQDDAIGCS